MSRGILEALHAAALRTPQAPALLHGAQAVSHAQLQALAAVTAAGLRQRGIRGGETVGLCMEQTPLHCVALLALLRMGALVAPFSPALPAAARARLAARYTLDRVLCDHDGGGIAGLPGLRLERISAGPAVQDTTPPPPPDTPARLALTSGTSGEPRAVLHRHGELLRRALHTTAGWDEGARLLPPRLHLTVASAAVLGTLCRGGAVVFPEGPEFGDLAAAVRRHAVTHLILSPAAALALAAQLPEGGLPGLRQLRLVGGPATPEQVEALVLRCTRQIHLSYALTELGLVAEADLALLASGPGCAGRVRDWVRLEVVDQQGRPLPPDEVGEIRVIGDPMPGSYYRDDGSGASATHFRDGWLYTGDLGSLSAAGLLRIEGRRDELLNFGGHKVLPQELERRLLRSALVRQAAVLSVPGADGAGQLAAALVPAPGATPPALLALCRELLGLADPQRLLLLEELPRNELGKVRRDELRRLAAARRP